MVRICRQHKHTFVDAEKNTHSYTRLTLYLYTSYILSILCIDAAFLDAYPHCVCMHARSIRFR